MGYWIRGRIPEEQRNPITRGLIAIYRPALDWVLRRPKLTLVIAVAVFATTTGRYVSYDVLREQVNRFGELWVVTSTDVTLAPLDPLRLAVVVAAHERVEAFSF